MKAVLNKVICVLILFSIINIPIASAANSPTLVLQSTADKIISELKRKQPQLQRNPQISHYIVTKYLLPMVDQEAMAQAVLGPAYWRRATATQRRDFIEQFRTLVIHTYAAAISQFSNERIEFLPTRNISSGSSGSNLLMVRSKSIRTGKPPIAVNYRLTQEGPNWKVVDFSVDGISMVESFKSQFSDQLSHSGIDGLINSLTQHNKRNQWHKNT